MAKYSALELLAPEIQLQVLVNADTPKDLYALIQASPRLYQVYLINKDLALSAVACRQFHPAVITEALFFAKISQLEKPLSQNSVTELCKIHPGKLQDELTIPIPMSVKLCELASNIRFFIEDYARNTLPIVKGLGQSLEVDILPSYSTEDSVSCSKLSDSETGRLQRAFCRFEIYRTLFAQCSSDLDGDHPFSDELSVSPAGQASMFFEKFPDFQVTEIICIRDYLYRRLRGTCSQLEDEAASTLPPETFMFDRDGDFESAQWASGVYLFTESGKYYQNQHIEHLMSLGLPYIRQIFESTGEEQKKLFIRHSSNVIVSHMENDFITMVIEVLEQKRNPVRGDLPLLAKTDPPFVYKINTDAYLDIPDAWQWAHPRAPPLCLVEKTLKGLRDWGYVFWDNDRLRESGMLGRNREDVRKTKFDEYEAAHTPSVQERLLGPSSPPEDYDPEDDGLGEDDLGYDSLGEDDAGHDSFMDDSPEDDAPADDNPGDRNLKDNNLENDSHVGSPEAESREDIIPEDTTITLKTMFLKVITVVGQTLRNVVNPWENSLE